MGYLIAIPLLGILAAFQSSIMPALRLQSGQADLILLVVLAWAVHARYEESLWWALVGGIMHDLLSIVPLGASAFGLLIMVFIIDTIRRALYQVNWLLWLVLVVLGTLLSEFIIIVVLAVSGYPSNVGVLLRSFVLPTLALHIVLALPVYALVRFLQARLLRARFTPEV